MSARQLTIAEASKITGLTYGAIVNACYSGALPAIKGKKHGYSKKPVWLINHQDLKTWKKRHQPAARSTAWDDGDIAALMELETSCTVAQLAAYLGRTYAAVQSKLKWLRVNGYAPDRERVDRVPFHCPKSGVWLAKTCPYCGNLRDATQFTMKPNKAGHLYPLTMCHACGIGDLRARQPVERMKRDDKWSRKLQQITASQATKVHQEYTSAEIEVLMDQGKSTFQVALELGRTYSGVATKRSALGFRLPVKEPKEYGHWLLHFPNALQALQDHFRALGVVPPEQWEWDDADERMSA